MQTPTGNRYCDYAQFGCNAWAKMDNYSNGVYTGVTEKGLGNLYSGPIGKYADYNNTFELKGKVERNSNINDYLNNDYYNKLFSVAKNQIVKYDYNIGGVSLEDNNYSENVVPYLSAKWFYEGNKDSYEKNPNDYSKQEMEKYQLKMEELKPLYDSYFDDIDSILKGNVDEEEKYTWNGNVAMASLTDVLEATTDTNTCGTLILVNTNGEFINGQKSTYQSDTINVHSESYSAIIAKYSYPNITNNCYQSNYLIPPETYKFTDYNYLLITPIYNSNELVYSASNQGLNPQYVYQDFGTVYYNSFSIRPVVHLNQEISITGGDGSEENPYTLSSMGGESSSNSVISSLIVDVPPTALFTSIFVIVGAIALLGISGYLYLKVFKNRSVK